MYCAGFLEHYRFPMTLVKPIDHCLFYVMLCLFPLIFIKTRLLLGQAGYPSTKKRKFD